MIDLADVGHKPGTVILTAAGCGLHFDPDEARKLARS